MTNQPEPIRKSSLPTTPPPEWEFHTVTGARTGTDGCALFPGDTGPVVVRRLVTYGDWEPVRPDRWADAPESAAASAAVAPPTQAAPSLRAGLRDEIVKALGRITTVPPVAHRREQADHVLAVLYREWPWLRAEAEDAEPTDRAAVLRWAADAIDAETRQAKADGVLEPDKYRPCRDASAQLRRMADETATQTPAADATHPCNAATMHRLGNLATAHGPHLWVMQPDMDPVRCPGTRKPAAGARQDGAET